MRQKHPPTITERDQLLLQFLAAQRVAVTSQLARLLDVGEPAARARAHRLGQAGLLICQPIFVGQPHAVWITRAGLRSVERPLSAPQLNLQAYRHDVGVVWLWLAAQDGAFGRVQTVVSEREMRSHDARAGNDHYGLGLWRTSAVGRGPGSDRHYPDLVLQTPRGCSLAIELELTGKSDARLREIMSTYLIDRRYDRVLYLVPDRKLGERIQAAARWAGASQLVGVQLVSGTDGVGGGPALVQQRARAATRSAHPEPTMAVGRRAA